MGGNYTGHALRSALHYDSRPPVPGLGADHFTGAVEPDIFNPVPETPAGATGEQVWSGQTEHASQSNMPNLAQQGVSHWHDGDAPVQSGVPTAQRMDAMAARMVADHQRVNTVPDSIRLYQHATEGQVNEFITGRTPQNAGVDPGENLQYLVNGRNSYDHTNQPNEVYAGDSPNVGRYRLGVKTNMYGLYDNPLGKFGQDALLRAYTGLVPQFPVDKPQATNTAPYTPNSTGTAHWAPAQPNQVVSNFSLPSETAMTDYVTAGGGGNPEFDDHGRL